MSGIAKWFLPLGVFVVGMILILIATIFFPAIETRVTDLQSATSSYSSNYFAFGAITGSTRLILYVMGIGIILIYVAVIWIRMRRQAR